MQGIFLHHPEVNFDRKGFYTKAFAMADDDVLLKVCQQEIVKLDLKIKSYVQVM